jgi:hypothetical protein
METLRNSKFLTKFLEDMHLLLQSRHYGRSEKIPRKLLVALSNSVKCPLEECI